MTLCPAIKGTNVKSPPRVQNFKRTQHFDGSPNKSVNFLTVRKLLLTPSLGFSTTPLLEKSKG